MTLTISRSAVDELEGLSGWKNIKKYPVEDGNQKLVLTEKGHVIQAEYLANGAWLDIRHGKILDTSVDKVIYWRPNFMPPIALINLIEG